MSDNIEPILQRLKSKNKWNFTGDYLSNFEKHLIPINPKMQQTFTNCVMVTYSWFRTLHKDLILPQNIDIIIGIFYTLPRCAKCGRFDNLWLNLCDGYIGCGRKQWDGTGSNSCALRHYSLYETEIENDTNNDRTQYFGMVIKLGTISEYGADVFDYKKDMMVMDALFIEDKNCDKNRNKRNEWTAEHALCVDELEPMLIYWGIKMGSMYKFDKTMEELEVEENVWMAPFR